MPAYLVPLYQERCAKCGMVATFKLYNSRHAIIGHYCKIHAESSLAAFKAKHEGINKL